MSGTVGIFRFDLGLPSETFIVEQVKSMRRYLPEYWVRNLADATQAFDVPVHQCDRYGALAGKMFSVWPTSAFFSRPDRLKAMDVLHAHFGPDGVYARHLAAKHDIPLVTTFHGYDVLKRRGELLKLGGFRVRRFIEEEPRLQSQGSAFIAVSEFVRNALVRLGYPASKVRTHHIGVDLARFKQRDAAEAPPERYVLSVGRHVEFKGIATLLRAFAIIKKQHDDVFLVQVGTGPLEEQHRKLASELGLGGSVRFLGSQPHADVTRLMKDATVFCLPSQTAQDGGGEALGIVFCEASACGIPVVSTKHGGIPEVVSDGETGILVSERDHHALAAAISTLLSNGLQASRMGAAGRQRMERMFDISKQTPLLEKIYDEIL